MGEDCKMESLSALSIANHLREIMIENFMSNHFANEVSYVQRNLSKYEETEESLIEQYEYHLNAFVDISSQFIGNRKRIEDLILISEPFVLYTFNAVFHNSIRILENEGESQKYTVPKGEKAMYKKFACLSMRFRKHLEDLSR